MSHTVEHFFAVMLFVFQFYTVDNFERFINFGLGTWVRNIAMDTSVDKMLSRTLLWI